MYVHTHVALYRELEERTPVVVQSSIHFQHVQHSLINRYTKEATEHHDHLNMLLCVLPRFH
jgi:hypothetical protein